MYYVYDRHDRRSLRDGLVSEVDSDVWVCRRGLAASVCTSSC